MSKAGSSSALHPGTAAGTPWFVVPEHSPQVHKSRPLLLSDRAARASSNPIDSTQSNGQRFSRDSGSKIPAAAVDSVIAALLPCLEAGDIIVDGGNSHYKEAIRRARRLADIGIYFLDCGTRRCGRRPPARSHLRDLGAQTR